MICIHATFLQAGAVQGLGGDLQVVIVAGAQLIVKRGRARLVRRRMLLGGDAGRDFLYSRGEANGGGSIVGGLVGIGRVGRRGLPRRLWCFGRNRVSHGEQRKEQPQR